MSIRESRNGGGDLRYDCEDAKIPTGDWWFGIWECGDAESGIAVRSEGNFPLDLEGWR